MKSTRKTRASRKQQLEGPLTVVSICLLLMCLFTCLPGWAEAEKSPDPTWKAKVQKKWQELKDHLPGLPTQSQIASTTDDLWKQLPDLKDVPVEKMIGILSQMAASLPMDLMVTQKWDYRVVDIAEIDPEKIEAEMRKLGQDGWDCFAIHQQPTGNTRYFFKKRPSSVAKTIFITENLMKLLFGTFSGPD